MTWLRVNGVNVSGGQVYGLGHATYLLTENVAFWRRRLGVGFSGSAADERVADAMDAFGNYRLAVEADREECWDLIDSIERKSA